MKKAGVHPSEDRLLMWADGELSAREAKSLSAHVQTCWECRTRLDEIKGSLAELTRLQVDLKESLPSATRARLRLQATLRGVVEEKVGGAGASRNAILISKIAHAAAVATLLIGTALITSYKFGQVNRTVAKPRSALTPGDAVFVSKTDICSRELENDPITVPVSLRESVFKEYGISHARPQDYQLDYLITPRLGGATSLRNLWPQPYSARWNARMKDRLEDRLHDMVCRGDVDLATAQQEMATDWVAAYRKYFRTQPVNRAW